MYLPGSTSSSMACTAVHGFPPGLSTSENLQHNHFPFDNWPYAEQIVLRIDYGPPWSFSLGKRVKSLHPKLWQSGFIAITQSQLLTSTAQWIGLLSLSLVCPVASEDKSNPYRSLLISLFPSLGLLQQELNTVPWFSNIQIKEVAKIQSLSFYAKLNLFFSPLTRSPGRVCGLITKSRHGRGHFFLF